MRKTILSLFISLMTSLTLSAQRIYLVSVGVADYPGKEMDIPGPDMDARAVFALYQTHAQASCVLLVDEKATVKAVKRQTRDLFSRASEDDIVVLFFSGHGYPGGFVFYDDTLGYSDIRKFFSETKAKNKMIFADACFAGAIRSGGSTSQADSADADSSIMLFLSSRDNESSLTSGRMRNSFFTTCLVRCLKGGADYNRDRTITARELFLGVREGVVDLSHDRQHPVMWGKFPNDMPVIRW